MYSGLLPKGLTEADLSSDGDDDQEDTEDREHHGDDDQDTEDREHHGDDDQEDTEDREHHGDDDQEDTEDREHHGGTNTNHNSGDADSSQTPTVQQHESCSLPGISQETWQKFKELQKKKNEIKETKDFKRRRRRHKKAGAINKDATEERAHQTEPEKHWDELKQYFGVNARFQPPACSKPPPKSGLEKSIDSAIAEGDVAKAEEMSDRLATRELGVKIAQAADCRDYVEHKKEEEASRAAQKRKNQITWGFEAKRRWETKSNMGYM